MPFNHGWILIILTLSLVVLTCLQAQGSVLTRNSLLIGHSRGYSIFFLRAFSELAGLSLAATISATLERVKWALLCRGSSKRPTRFLDFLALQEGTTVIGLLSLAATPGVSSLWTRLWSVVRLALMVLIPATGVVIMSTFPLAIYACLVQETLREM